MMKRNVVELIGNLCDDPEFRDMGNFKLANFMLAVDRIVELNDGNNADFIPIVCKNDLAVAVDTYARKGRRVFVDGRIHVRTYQDDNNNRRWATEIVAKSIQYLDAPPEDVVNGNQNRNPNSQGRNFQGNGGGQRGGSRRNNSNSSHNSNHGNGGRRSGNGGYNRASGNSGGNQRYGNLGGDHGQNSHGYSRTGIGGGQEEYSGQGRMPWE